MTRKQRVIEEARRILRNYEVAAQAVGGLPTGAGGAESSDLESVSVPFESLGAGRGGAAVAEPAPVARAIAEERAQRVAQGVEAMKKVELGQDDRISDDEQNGLEAIILLAGRPAILIQEGDFLEPPSLWSDLKNVRPQIKNAIARVGRIEVANNPSFEWLGTGFLAGADVIVTNRHVALEFSKQQAGGEWIFRAPMTSSVNFKAELGSEDTLTFHVTSIVGIHDDYDMAILKVEQTAGPRTLPDPLPVATQGPATLLKSRVYVIGYPAWDGRRNDPEPMKRIFADIYNVKRLQPGEISGDDLASFEFFHDCSTLGGNSGSPVFDLDTHRVLGLHFGGRFLEKNHAVPLWKLQADPLVQRARFNYV